MNLDPKLRIICFLMLMMCLTTACKEPDPPKPEIKPCFTVENDTFMDPKKPVQFLNCSEMATSYHWYFGDGGESEEANPAHLFSTPGIYDVALSAKNGEYQELLFKRIKVAYPIFKKIRILRMPVMNRQGVPYDPDGSGLDLRCFFTRANEHFPAGGVLMYDLSIPGEVAFPSIVDINSSSWTFEFSCIGLGAVDTITFSSRNYLDLIDAPIEHFAADSVAWDLVMEGAQ